MKLETGMYVRTKDDEICKCLNIFIDDNNSKLNRFMNEWGNMIMFDEIKGEPSHNIIDLIEVGDYVNGRIVKQNYFDDIKYLPSEIKEKINRGIKSIVTKEQIEGMSYKL